MAFDREATLKKAEKLLRQGRLEPAIAEYLRVVEADPNDWMTANTLGDLYVRAGQADKAGAQYRRVADHFMSDGFYPKAAAIYKKLLKLNPEDESAQLQLADLSQMQGLLADAKAHLNAIATRRRSRGDRAGTAEIVLRLGAVDPNDFEARLTAARTMAEMGDEEGAASRFRGIHDDLVEKDRLPEALEALRQAAKLNPYDRDTRVILAKAAVGEGDIERARAYLDRETAGDDPSLLHALLEVDLKADDRLDEVRQLVPRLMALSRDDEQKVVELAWSTAEARPDAAFVMMDSAADHAAGQGHFSDAATLLQEFVARVPHHIPALLKLVEVCVDGGLESTMNEAQGNLADAYLASGQATEARVIAEDLVAREPWQFAHIDRFRRALVMLKISDPDSVIAERLSGQTPFMATDVFADTPARAARLEAVSNRTAMEPAKETPPPPAEEEPPVARDEDRDRVEPQEPASADVAPEEPEPAQPSRPTPIKLSSFTKPTSDDGEIDLSGALGGLDADDQMPSPAEEKPASNLEAAFKGLRQQASDQGTDQSAQHMTLARTYLEMGLPDQAIASLETAARSTRFRFEAASMLGRIHKDRGDVSKATEWLERAAEAPPPTAEEGREVIYDLAMLLEHNGEAARALAILLELQSDAGDYRDIDQHIARLTRLEAESKTETGG